MEKTFIVDLESPEPGKLENFEREGKNIARVQIQLASTVADKPGKTVYGSDYIVEICLSKEARLGLGIELIRSAIKGPDMRSVVSGETLYFTEMHPSEKGHAVQDFGIFLHPKSCKVLICGDDFGTIEEVIEKAEKEKSAL